MKKRGFAKERGQSLVLVAAAMVVLVGFVALAVDLGNAYYARRTAQNGADGAALAGASRLSAEINKKNYVEKQVDRAVEEDMIDFAQRNEIEDTTDDEGDVENGNVDGWYVDTDGNRIVVDGVEAMVGSETVPDNVAGVEAITYITATSFFGGIFGIRGYPIQARAVSLIHLACGSDCLVPIVAHMGLVLDNTEEPPEPRTDECFNIWKERVLPSKDVSAGLLGWVNWTWQEAVCSGETECEPEPRPCPLEGQGQNACNAEILEANLNPNPGCASGFVRVGDWIAAAPGDMSSGPNRCALDYYLDFDDPENDCTDDEPHSFTVPVYDYTTADPPWNIKPAMCGAMPDPCHPEFTEPTYALHYHVAGLARMQILQYRLSSGGSEEIKYPADEDLTQAQLDRINECIDYYDFYCDPVLDPDCDIDIEDAKANSFRITVEFLEWVDDYDSTDECYDPYGTLWASPKLTD